MGGSLAAGVDDHEVYDTFEAMSLREDLLKGIMEYGFEKPSWFQQRGIVPFSQNCDLILVGEYEPGQRTICCAGILQQLEIPLAKSQALVFVRNSSIAKEIAQEMHALGHYLDAKVHAVGYQKEEVFTDVHVLVGNPYNIVRGEITKSISLDGVKVVVLDEPDKMSSDDLDRIYEIFRSLHFKDKIQVGVFAETIPNNIDKIKTELGMDKPLTIIGKELDLYGGGMKKHLFVEVENNESKFKALHELHRRFPKKKIIVFVDLLPKVEYVRSEMTSRYECEFLAISKFMDQKAKNRMNQDFLEIGVLISMEWLARGVVEVKHVDMIVNFDLPFDHVYFRCVGRFNEVEVVNFVTNNDWYYLLDYQTHLGLILEKLSINSHEVLLEKDEMIHEEYIDHFVRNCESEEDKFDELFFCIGKALAMAIVPTVFFVDTCERGAQLAKELKKQLGENSGTILTLRNDGVGCQMLEFTNAENEC